MSMGHQLLDYHSTKNSCQPKILCGRAGTRLHVSSPGNGLLRPAAVFLLFGFIAGCSLSGPKTAGLASDATLITGSVAKPVQVAGIETTDAEVIKTTVADARINSSSAMALAWVNPNTGSSGTITTIDNFLGKHGQKCRGFKTTVSTFMGIAFYNGETCQVSPTEWVLSWFRRSENKS